MSRIDVHQHILPPGYVKWLHSMNVLEAGGRDLPDWSAAGAIDLMDKYDIESAVLSVSTPGAYLGDGHDAATVARMVNESSAECVKDHAGRFGFRELGERLGFPQREGSQNFPYLRAILGKGRLVRIGYGQAREGGGLSRWSPPFHFYQ